MSNFLTTMTKRPHGAHWAIITLRTITIPGDERSRSAPGHGYPESQETVVDYKWFSDEASFSKELQEAFNSRYDRDRMFGICVSATLSPKTIAHVEMET